MTEKRKRSWKQRVVSVLICLCVSWLIYVEAMNLIAWHFARETSQTHPNLAVVPTLLVDTSVAELAGPRIEKFGISFRVPWKEVGRDVTAKSLAMVSFKEGGGIMIFDPATEVDGAKIMQGKTPSDQKIMTNVFGSQTLSSNYQLMAAEALATPADVRWWATRSSNIRNGILLMNKSMNLRDAKAIYRIDTGGMRGFQYGDPMVSPYNVNLDLFDGSDWHYKLTIVGQNDHRPVITQAQINGLVASFRGLSGVR